MTILQFVSTTVHGAPVREWAYNTAITTEKEAGDGAQGMLEQEEVPVFLDRLRAAWKVL
jgi:hypothetical protein